MEDEGQRLPGGNVGGAWRVGDTVRRTTGPWSPAVHALLRHLDGRLPSVPRVHGIDGFGREVLDFLPGRIVDVDNERLAIGQLHSIAAWTRSLHEAVADFHHDGPWRGWPVPTATLIGHNDIAPYNVCFDGDQLAGVFDWDLAGPTTPLLELGFVAWNCVPMWTDVGAEIAAERLTVIAEGYGGVAPADIAASVQPRMQPMLDWMPEAARIDAGVAALLGLGEPEASQRALNALMARLPQVLALL